MKFINFLVITGIDGSGKTTQAKLLMNNFKQSIYVWNRYEPFLLKPAFILAKYLFLRGLDPFENYKNYNSRKKELFEKSILSFLFQFFLIIDYSLIIIWRILIPLLKGKIVICDRYIYDTIVDIAAESGYSIPAIYQIYKIILKVLPEPRYFILIDIKEEIAFQRKDDVPSIYYLKLRKKLYHDIFSTRSPNDVNIRINGSQSIEDIHQIILEGLLNKNSLSLQT